MIPRDRDEFKDRILSELGEPVIKVNIAPSQLDNAIDDSIDFYRNYHVDGSERFFLKIQIPKENYQDIIKQNYITLPENVFAVLNVHNAKGIFLNDNNNLLSDTFQINQTLAFSMINNINGAGVQLPVTQYIVTRQYLSDMQSVSRTYLRFDYRYSHNSHNKLTFHDDLSNYVAPDGYLIIECQGYLNDIKNLYGSRELRNLATAYAKKYWGMNLKKYSGVTLPSGLTLNGESIYQDSLQDIQNAEQDIKGQQEPFGIVIA